MWRINLWSSLVILAIWLGLTVGVAVIQNSGSTADLSNSVSTSIGLCWVLALGFLLFIVALSDKKDIGLNAPHPTKSLWLLWLPVAYIALMGLMVLIQGFPPSQVIMYVAINTGMVGISEELMYRGILFRGLLTKIKIWPAILVSSAAFGVMHVLNVFLTGEFQMAAYQAGAATITGIAFMAIRIRTQSIFPMILIHAAWDFLTFMLGLGGHGNASNPASAAAPAYAALLLPLPLFLYGLYLLRHANRDYQFMSERNHIPPPPLNHPA
jgi:membrane protease YdiL (CAAX protease family)